MAREARQADSEWLPAEILPVADDAAPESDGGRTEDHPLAEVVEMPTQREGSEPVSTKPADPAGEGNEADQWQPDLVQETVEEPIEPDALERVRAEPPEPTVEEDVGLEGQLEPSIESRLPAPSWAPTAPTAPAPVPAGTVDLNQASFDQLRRLGLSFHQASGLIGRREQQGGYFSLEDLEELEGVYGLRREQIEALKQAAGA
jgi:hypothetical protein